MWNTIQPRTKLPTSSFINKYYLRVLDKTEKANRDHQLYRKNQKIVVGLSGGADSVSLLVLLKRQERRQGLRIFAAHIDHGLHSQSRKQARFCETLCRALDVPFYSKSIRLAALARSQKRSKEEAGRLARYDFFSDICRKTGSRLIATAHTLDDQAETILMRLLRGTGLRGLVAIPWKRKVGVYMVIRPLLYCEKKELLSWLRAERIRYCNDPTNRDEAFTRNFVRGTLIPLLEKKLNPQAKRALADYQSAFQDAFNHIERQAEALYRRVAKKKGSRILVRRLPGQSTHVAVVDEMLRMALSKLKGDHLGLGFQHIRQLRNLYTDRGRIGKTLQFPGHWVAVNERSGLRIAPSRAR